MKKKFSGWLDEAELKIDRFSQLRCAKLCMNQYNTKLKRAGNNFVISLAINW